MKNINKQKGFLHILGMLYVVLWLIIVGSWIGNFFKLLDCDFEPSYKGEIIHAIGLIPVASVITVWYDDK